MTVWHAIGTAPVAVECEVPGYPNLDANGATMYENTHFADEAAAWAQVLAECYAGESLDASAVIRVEEELKHRKDRLVRSAIAAVEARENFEKWKAKQ